MLRSLYSGIGGMGNFQNKLDVIGNNISNVNTHGFKKGRTTFNDLVSQQMQGAGAAGAQRGGTNPQQIGLGGGMSTIDTVNTQGSLQTTGRDLDLAITGDGYFVVQDGDQMMYTRAGNFYLDSTGTLVNGDGLSVMGVGPGNDADAFGEGALGPLTIQAGAAAGDIGADIDDAEATLQSFSIAPSGEINGVFSNGQSAVLGRISMANFANPGGLNKAGNNTYAVTANSGDPQFGTPGTQGRGELVGASLEMSNVDLSEEFAEMIIAQRGFQANTRMITTSDEILQELVNLKR
ncbi:flagellar basal body rod protein FlgG [Alkalicoccus luteus]|uniref:flagellar basal body rod protein FlgG n=1 Tax=Alkalicoccus luteus TaxID=1237094 RepID=UPI0040336BA4